MPTTSSSRSSITPKPGRIRSTPGWFSSGNRTPQSISSSCPCTPGPVMFRPMSPSPPSGITRTALPWRVGGFFSCSAATRTHVTGERRRRGRTSGAPLAAGAARASPGEPRHRSPCRRLRPAGLAGGGRRDRRAAAPGLGGRAAARTGPPVLGRGDRRRWPPPGSRPSPGRRRPAAACWWRSRIRVVGYARRCPPPTPTPSRGRDGEVQEFAVDRRPARAATAHGCSTPAPTPCEPTGSPAPAGGSATTDDGLRRFLTAAGWARGRQRPGDRLRRRRRPSPPGAAAHGPLRPRSLSSSKGPERPAP